MNKTDKISMLANIVLISFFAAIFTHVLLFHFGINLPYTNSFLYRPDWLFCDFTHLADFLKDFAPYKNPSQWVNYLPFAYILMLPFALIKSSFIGCTSMILFFLCCWIFLNIKFFTCKKVSFLQNFQNIFILSTISYPFCFYFFLKKSTKNFL